MLQQIFDILTIRLSILHNYFENYFFDLYLTKILDFLLVKPFFPLYKVFFQALNRK